MSKYKQLGADKILTASKSWGDCGCGCGKIIKEGTKFQIDVGVFYLEGHLNNKGIAEVDVVIQEIVPIKSIEIDVIVTKEKVEIKPRGRPKKQITVEQIESKQKEKEDAKTKWFL